MKVPKYVSLAIASALYFCSVAAAQSPSSNLERPSPPAQATAWITPSTSLPEEVVRAMAVLFDQGMADPRGCEYREVEIALDHPLKTHAWVLPASAGQARYAVGWNGLVYPVTGVGAPADLAKDLAVSVVKWRFRAGVEPVGESYALSTESVLRIKVALLLRLGEVALAEKFWREGGGEDKERLRVDPYADMTAVWLGSWYNGAVRAYLRDDYPTALAVCHQLSPVLARARETARFYGILDPWPERFDGLPFWQMPILVAETQRRIDAPPRVPALDFGQSVAEPERIAALIHDLEQVRVRQWMTPGQTDVLDDAVVQALVKEGDAAVPALLRCLVEDQRLTRSRFTGGGWTNESGPIIPVYEAAYTALFRLLDVKFLLFAHDSGKETWRNGREPRDLAPEDRRVLAAKLEAAWQAKRGVDPLEHAYHTLRDDAAGEKAWLQAVDTIVQPTNGQFTEYLLVPPAVGGYEGYVSDKPFTPGGESLRSRADPSVSELMIRRFGQLSEGDESSWGLQRTDRPGKFLLALAAWDGKAHLRDLRRLQGELQARFRHLAATPPARKGQGQNLFEQAQVLVRLFEARVDLGDVAALADYADFLEPLTPRMLGTTYAGTTELFRLMWRHPDVPAIVRAADKMFGAGSPWVPLVQKDTHDLNSLIHSRLVSVPAFERELLRGLGDTSEAGQVVLGEDGHLNDGTSRLYALDPLAPPKGTKAAYRLCDRYAHALSEMDGFPRCELYWPQAERDRAVEASRAFLVRYADHFRYQENEDKNRDHFTYPGPSIRFPALDHPATEEDVRAGRAIFSLPPPARVCRLSSLPLTAERPGNKADPSGGVTVGADGTSRPAVSYNSRGAIWQAEETLVDGQWERYFGFVGRYQLEKVPAAEVEFPLGHEAGNVTPQISGALVIVLPRPSGGVLFGYSMRNFLPLGERASIQVQVENHTGFEQTVPSTLMLPAGAAKGSLPAGIRLILSYSEKLPERTQRFADPPFDYGTWREVPPREDVRAVSSEALGPVLLPGEYGRVIMDIDLRDYFDLSRPGSYRLQAMFQVTGQPESPASGAVFSVAQ